MERHFSGRNPPGPPPEASQMKRLRASDGRIPSVSEWGAPVRQSALRPMVGDDFFFSFELPYLRVSRNLV
jgi:hypothetical protein